MRFRLSAEDRERLGCAEVVEYDESRLMFKDVSALQHQVGWSLERLGAELEGKVVLDEAGQPMYERDEQGNETRDADNKRVPLREIDVDAIGIAIWLAVRRSGTKVSWEDFDFDFPRCEIVEDEPEGKVPESESTPSTTSSG